MLPDANRLIFAAETGTWRACSSTGSTRAIHSSGSQRLAEDEEFERSDEAEESWAKMLRAEGRCEGNAGSALSAGSLAALQRVNEGGDVQQRQQSGTQQRSGPRGAGRGGGAGARTNSSTVAVKKAVRIGEAGAGEEFERSDEAEESWAKMLRAEGRCEGNASTRAIHSSGSQRLAEDVAAAGSIAFAFADETSARPDPERSSERQRSAVGKVRDADRRQA
jgi:hypothetical protein